MRPCRNQAEHHLGHIGCIGHLGWIGHIAWTIGHIGWIGHIGHFYQKSGRAAASGPDSFLPERIPFAGV